MKLDSRALKLRGKLLNELRGDYRDRNRKAELDADTPGSDWLIVYSYNDDNMAWLAISQSNYEYFMKRLGDNCLDEWKYSNYRTLWANVAIQEVWWEIEDLFYALDRHADLNGDRSTELQEEMDIEYIESCKPTHAHSHLPEDWAWRIYSWITRQGSGEFRVGRIEEAAAALGFLTRCECPNGHFALNSDEKEHWLW